MTTSASATSQLLPLKTTDTLAKCLGWFSVGLGVTQLVAPDALSRYIGIRPNTSRMRTMGVRELSAGIGILATRRMKGWLWARTGGDVVDIASLAVAGMNPRAKRSRVACAMAAVAGVTALDVVCATRLSRQDAEGVRRIASVQINRTPEECYRLWHDFERLPEFMRHLRSVRVTGANRSHWITKPIAGKEYSWDAEVTEDIPNEQIAWRSVQGDVNMSGRVRFQPARAGKGTIVRVFMTHDLPASATGLLLGMLPGKDPGMALRKELLGFKQLLEAGEIATTEGQSAGGSQGATRLDRLARV